MGIVFNEDNKLVHIQSKRTSYILSVLETGHLINLYPFPDTDSIMYPLFFNFDIFFHIAALVILNLSLNCSPDT